MSILVFGLGGAPVNCDADYTHCDASCGVQTLVITTPAANGGTPCPTQQELPCLPEDGDCQGQTQSLTVEWSQTMDLGLDEPCSEYAYGAVAGATVEALQQEGVNDATESDITASCAQRRSRRQLAAQEYIITFATDDDAEQDDVNDAVQQPTFSEEQVAYLTQYLDNDFAITVEALQEPPALGAVVTPNAVCDENAGCEGDETLDTTARCAGLACSASDRETCCEDDDTRSGVWSYSLAIVMLIGTILF